MPTPLNPLSTSRMNEVAKRHASSAHNPRFAALGQRDDEFRRRELETSGAHQARLQAPDPNSPEFFEYLNNMLENEILLPFETVVSGLHKFKFPSPRPSEYPEAFRNIPKVVWGPKRIPEGGLSIERMPFLTKVSLLPNVDQRRFFHQKFLKDVSRIFLKDKAEAKHLQTLPSSVFWDYHACIHYDPFHFEESPYEIMRKTFKEAELAWRMDIAWMRTPQEVREKALAWLKDPENPYVPPLQIERAIRWADGLPDNTILKPGWFDAATAHDDSAIYSPGHTEHYGKENTFKFKRTEEYLMENYTAKAPQGAQQVLHKFWNGLFNP